LGEIITPKVLLAAEQKGKGEKQERKNKNMKNSSFIEEHELTCDTAMTAGPLIKAPPSSSAPGSASPMVQAASTAT